MIEGFVLPKELTKEEWKALYFDLSNFCEKVHQRRGSMDDGKGHLKILEISEKDALMEENPMRTDIFSVDEEVKI